MKKDQVFCLENDCQDRLICPLCFIRDRQHIDHNYIVIKGFQETNLSELTNIFRTTVSEILKEGTDFKQSFIQKINHLLDDREDRILKPIMTFIREGRKNITQLIECFLDQVAVGQFKSLKQMQEQMRLLIDDDCGLQMQQQMKFEIDKFDKVNRINQRLESLFQDIHAGYLKSIEKIQAIGYDQV